MIATTRPEISVSEPTLYVACELSKKEWKLAMTSGVGRDPWLRTVASRGPRGGAARGAGGAAAVRAAPRDPGGELL